jgi:hypothetical protein
VTSPFCQILFGIIIKSGKNDNIRMIRMHKNKNNRLPPKIFQLPKLRISFFFQ